MYYLVGLVQSCFVSSEDWDTSLRTIGTVIFVEGIKLGHFTCYETAQYYMKCLMCEKFNYPNDVILI